MNFNVADEEIKPTGDTTSAMVPDVNLEEVNNNDASLKVPTAVEDILNCELEHKSAELRKPAIVLIKKGSGIFGCRGYNRHVTTKILKIKQTQERRKKGKLRPKA